MIHIEIQRVGIGADALPVKIVLNMDDELRPLVIRVLEALAVKLEGEAPTEINITSPVAIETLGEFTQVGKMIAVPDSQEKPLDWEPV